MQILGPLLLASTGRCGLVRDARCSMTTRSSARPDELLGFNLAELPGRFLEQQRRKLHRFDVDSPCSRTLDVISSRRSSVSGARGTSRRSVHRGSIRRPPVRGTWLRRPHRAEILPVAETLPLRSAPSPLTILSMSSCLFIVYSSAKSRVETRVWPRGKSSAVTDPGEPNLVLGMAGIADRLPETPRTREGHRSPRGTGALAGQGLRGTKHGIGGIGAVSRSGSLASSSTAMRHFLA
jgi:hypothetical protein